MILQHSILNVFLIAFATAAVVDQEPPEITCPDDIVVDDITTSDRRVNWQQPTATDNSGVVPSTYCSRQSGDLFSVPGENEEQCLAVDDTGNEATCSFRITLNRKTCPFYAPPENGALACFNTDFDVFCAVMCNGNSDFAFDPPMVYFCLDGQWNFFSSPGVSYSTELPWPNCSYPQANSSSLKTSGIPYFFYIGDANDPNVQVAIKTNFISLMKSTSYIPPFFCTWNSQCTEDNTDVYAGAWTDQEPPVFTSCPDDIVVDDATSSEMRVNWQQPTATDNSDVVPSIACSRQSGDLFSVPGSSEVQCLAVDGTGNEATCSFRITLNLKTCPLYAPPENGALACFNTGFDLLCVAMCNNNTDFVFNPPMVYYCSSGVWIFYSLPGIPYSTQLPWPDCSYTQVNSVTWKTLGNTYFFYNGDAIDPNVQAAIKTNFISLMTSSHIPPIFCALNSNCREDNIDVYAGALKV